MMVQEQNPFSGASSGTGNPVTSVVAIVVAGVVLGTGSVIIIIVVFRIGRIGRRQFAFMPQ